MWKVTWSKSVEKDLARVPEFIRQKFRAWVVAIEHDGMPAVRELKGFHDEPLRGPRSGQRSVRLNRAYRVIYIEEKDGQIRIANVIEVNKHEY
jgi:proteic killer suppression protein